MNEVEETLRVLNTQIEVFKKEVDTLNKAFQEFITKCKPVLDDACFTIVCTLFESAIEYYEQCCNDSDTARKEIMDKYGIPYPHIEEDDAE